MHSGHSDVRGMFNRIAGRYDLANRVLSFGCDRAWRRLMTATVLDVPGVRQGRILDIATGTGDILAAFRDANAPAFLMGLDGAENMLALARRKLDAPDSRVPLVQGDALDLPFSDDSLDALTVAFGLRNFGDTSRAAATMRRVLRPGGMMCILEFSLPSSALVRMGYLPYLRHVLPRLGGLISGDRAAYRYLNTTIESFPHGERLCAIFRAAGFQQVTARPLSLGVATLYTGVK